MKKSLSITGFLLTVLFVTTGSQQLLAQTPIDDLPSSSWLWCNSCATTNQNSNAKGGVANIAENPPQQYTIDGSSVRFDLKKNTTCSSNCYGNVFFYNILEHNVSETSVTMDMYAMMDTAGLKSQAVEFTVEDNVCKVNCGASNEEDFRYTMSLQCSFSNGLWRYWNGSGNGGTGAWVNTQYNCVHFQPDSFNHFVFHFLRGDQNITYVDMWINGVQYPINKSDIGIQYSTPNSQAKFEASVQLDGDSVQDQYSMWVDKWSITHQ